MKVNILKIDIVWPLLSFKKDFIRRNVNLCTSSIKSESGPQIRDTQYQPKLATVTDYSMIHHARTF